jgi:hypothetical protein
MNKQPLYTVYRIAWDGEPSMSGQPHVMSAHREFDSYEDAAAAIARTTLKDKTGVRIESRLATDWRNATS